LATLSVILNDWEHAPFARSDPDIAMEISEMQSQLARCKTIVTGILRSSGEERGEDAERNGVIAFTDGVVRDWRISRQPASLDYVNRLATDHMIASDALLKQILFNILDNALEASPGWMGVDIWQHGDDIHIAVSDAGAGFSSEMLAELGRPYRSTKMRPGGGLGLFLVVNVLRKLGGKIAAGNRPQGGAIVELSLPLASLAVEVVHGS
jgi:two-component system sensor histidine kinase RegB